jgi:hypothetical protein
MRDSQLPLEITHRFIFLQFLQVPMTEVEGSIEIMEARMAADIR